MCGSVGRELALRAQSLGWLPPPEHIKLGEVFHVETEGSEVQRHPWLCSEFKANMGFMRPSKKKSRELVLKLTSDPRLPRTKVGISWISNVGISWISNVHSLFLVLPCQWVTLIFFAPTSKQLSGEENRLQETDTFFPVCFCNV